MKRPWVGRYGLVTENPFELRQRFRAGEEPFAVARYNVAPTQLLPVVGDRLMVLPWGVTTRAGRLVINARGETVADRPLFARALRSRRVVVPASWYYEWREEEGGKQPYRFGPRAGLLAFAGLIVGDGFVICTTTPNTLAATVHDRMPAILDSEAERIWRDSRVTDPADLLPLLRPCDEDLLIMQRVSRALNRVANDGPDLLDPDYPP